MPSLVRGGFIYFDSEEEYRRAFDAFQGGGAPYPVLSPATVRAGGGTWQPGDPTGPHGGIGPAPDRIPGGGGTGGSIADELLRGGSASRGSGAEAPPRGGVNPGPVGRERPGPVYDEPPPSGGGGGGGAQGFKTLEQMLAAGDISAPMAATITGTEPGSYRGVGQGIPPAAAGATAARGPQISGFKGDLPFASAQTLANWVPSARKEYSDIIGRLGGRAEDMFSKGLRLSEAPGSRMGYSSSGGYGGGVPSSRRGMYG